MISCKNMIYYEGLIMHNYNNNISSRRISDEWMIYQLEEPFTKPLIFSMNIPILSFGIIAPEALS